MRLLEALPQDGDLVFGKLQHNSLVRLLDKFEGLRNADGEKPTPHGFRHIFSTWAAEHRYPYEVREMALAHNVGSHIERTYNSADLLEDRRRLMAAWADHVNGVDSEVVVPLHRGART